MIVDEVTEDIWKSLLTELKVEMDLMLLKDPRKLFKDDPN